MALSVLHISESDLGGGAARAAYRIHTSLQSAGHESRMLVGRRLSSDETVRRLKQHAGWRAADRAMSATLDRAGLQYVCYPSSFGVAADPWFRGASVLQLHNTHGSYFSHTALPFLTRRRPTVWLLHDMWPVTGHVAYSHECERWRLGCGGCPRVRDYPALPRDTTALLWRIKRAVYARSRLTIVVPSRWLREVVESSPLLGGFEVERIPYSVDLEAFRPAPRDVARRRHGLPLDRSIVLFVGDATDERKGFRDLAAALARLSKPPLLAVAGRAAPAAVETVDLGSLTSDDAVADAYRAADLAVVPSLADNLPNVVLESLACGTPCVAYATGGIPDVIRDGETGMLVPPGDTESLGRAVATLLGEPAVRDRVAAAGRSLVASEHRSEVEAQRYASLYERLLETR